MRNQIEPESQASDGKRKDLNVLSLFSGCGGMDLGFEGGFNVHANSIHSQNIATLVSKLNKDGTVCLRKTRFHTVFANDILPAAQMCWVKNFSRFGLDPKIFHRDSVVDLVKRHKSGISVFPNRVDIVTGGFPCQDFSLSGKRKGLNSYKDHRGEIILSNEPTEETRGKLYMWMREVIGITQPKVFIAENVKGLINLGHVKDIIREDFSGSGGYLVLAPRVLHTADFGIPQSRERVIFIGFKKSALTRSALNALSAEDISPEYDPYPQPTHAWTRQDPVLAPPVKLKDILSRLPEPEKSSDLSHQGYSKAKYMGAHCQGQTEVKLDGLGPTIRSEHHGNIEFRRLSKEHGGKYSAELSAGLPERRLTPRECALIQSFPPNFELVIPKQVSVSAAYKIIGNAVPPLLAFHISNRLETLWGEYFRMP